MQSTIDLSKQSSAPASNSSAASNGSIDLSSFAKQASLAGNGRSSKMAEGLVGSEILKIAAEIRALVAGGQKVLNLTVGDFDPKQFPIPEELKAAIVSAYDQGETNYPPSNGMPELRSAVKKFYEDRLGLSYPVDSVLICSGARPVIYGVYRAVIDPGDVVVVPLPSWNNNHYVHMTGAVPAYVETSADSKFLPTRESLLKVLPKARLICLNTPLNPTGTAIDEESLRAISEAIVAENNERKTRGEKPCYLMFDHIYFLLTSQGTKHLTPPGLIPEMAAYTIFVDGISKGFASTGLRVGWAVGPTDIIDRMSAIIGHVGAWAPRAEQVATANFLNQTKAVDGYLNNLRTGVNKRLTALFDGFQDMKASGLDVDALAPEGAIYLTVRMSPFGKTTPDGTRLQTNEDVRKYVLSAARIGVVPFQAFGVPGESGWFRLSVGAVSEAEIQESLPRLKQALLALS